MILMISSNIISNKSEEFLGFLLEDRHPLVLRVLETFKQQIQDIERLFLSGSVQLQRFQEVQQDSSNYQLPLFQLRNLLTKSGPLILKPKFLQGLLEFVLEVDINCLLLDEVDHSQPKVVEGATVLHSIRELRETEIIPSHHV